MNRFRVVPVFIVSSLLAVALTGCWPSGPEEPTPSPTSPVAESETPTPDPTPTEPPVVLATECSELLDAATLTAMMASSFPLVDAAGTSAYVDKIRGEGNMLADFVDNGGLLCLTSNGNHVGEVFGYSTIAPAAAATHQAVLLDRGYTITAHLGGDLYSDTTLHEGVVFEYLFAGGYWFCGIDSERLDETVANSGVPL